MTLKITKNTSEASLISDVSLGSRKEMELELGTAHKDLHQFVTQLPAKFQFQPVFAFCTAINKYLLLIGLVLSIFMNMIPSQNQSRTREIANMGYRRLLSTFLTK